MDTLVETITVGPLKTNCYVLSDGKVCVVVDPGGSPEIIKQRIADRGWTGVAVLLTHGHFDHTMALSDFVKDGYKVYIHEADEKMLHNEWNLADRFGIDPLPDITPDVLLHDDDELTFGEMEIRVIHTPGHTKGSCCFDFGDYLVTGDTLFFHAFGSTDFPGGNMIELRGSIHKLFKIHGDRIILPGHNERTTVRQEVEYLYGWFLW